jgi:hypothetical protein
MAIAKSVGNSVLLAYLGGVSCALIKGKDLTSQNRRMSVSSEDVSLETYFRNSASTVYACGEAFFLYMERSTLNRVGGGLPPATGAGWTGRSRAAVGEIDCFWPWYRRICTRDN